MCGLVSIDWQCGWPWQWQWLGGSGLTVAGWQWIDSVRVAVALLHKCLVCFSLGVSRNVGGSGSVAVAVAGWHCQWLRGSGSVAVWQ
jgi:hypothetical protein